MTEAIDWDELRGLARLPRITLDAYRDMPQDISKQIEVVDGWLVRCESPEPSHQAIAHNLVNGLRGAAKRLDRENGTCHRVIADLDVLLSEGPISEGSRLHFRRPDVVVYRCIDTDRGNWGRKPYAADCLLVLEIVSADSVTTDIRDKRAEYAGAGIPHYWIVRMTDNDGPAISIERFLLTVDGDYIREGLAVRGRDFHAVDTINPVPLTLTWEDLDDGL
jgi:Uma2 family endonuclease